MYDACGACKSPLCCGLGDQTLCWGFGPERDSWVVPTAQLVLGFLCFGIFLWCRGSANRRSSIRTLEITVGLSRDSCIGKAVLLLNGFYPKSSQQSYWPHTPRFFYSVLSVLSFFPAPLRVVSSSIRAIRVQYPWISIFLYIHPHTAAKIAFPQFSISSFWSLSCEHLKRLMSIYCKKKKN